MVNLGKTRATKWQKCCWEQTVGISQYSDGNSLPIIGSPKRNLKPRLRPPVVVRCFFGIGFVRGRRNALRHFSVSSELVWLSTELEVMPLPNPSKPDQPEMQRSPRE